MVSDNKRIIMYGTSWCGDTRRARRIFDELETVYEYFDIDKDMDARKEVERINNGNRSVPTIIFADGSILVEPSSEELREKLSGI